jgi:hypothetical protein
LRTQAHAFGDGPCVVNPARRTLLWRVGALALLAIGLLAAQIFHARSTNMASTAALPRVLVDGGDGGGLPRAQPAYERMDAAALERAATDRAASGLQVFVVMRDGEIVFERYGHDLAGDAQIDSGAFAQVLVALAAGVATTDGAMAPGALQGFAANAWRAALEAGTQQRYEVYLSRNVWSRLNAAPAWIQLPMNGAATPADCCFHARLLDWMRIANLLVDDGRFEGKQIVPHGWVQRMQRPISLDAVRGLGVELAASARGAEGFATGGVFFVRGPGRWRMWLVPQLKLAVLFGAATPGVATPGVATPGVWDETRLPNLVIRAVSDRQLQPGDATDLQRLVPGH